MARRGVDDAGVDGRAAETCEHQPCEGAGARGQEEQRDADQQDQLPQADHALIAQPYGEEAARRTPGGHAEEK